MALFVVAFDRRFGVASPVHDGVNYHNAVTSVLSAEAAKTVVHAFDHPFAS